MTMHTPLQQIAARDLWSLPEDLQFCLYSVRQVIPNAQSAVRQCLEVHHQSCPKVELTLSPGIRTWFLSSL